MFLSGGTGKKSVEKYSLEAYRWTKLPDMNEVRAMHASCIVGSSLFVFCGSSPDLQANETFERFDTEKVGAQWELIMNLKVHCITRRLRPAACPLNESEILILGRKASNHGTCQSNAVIFDTLTNSSKEVCDSKQA